MEFSGSIVVLSASLPHAEIWRPIGPFHIEHKVLDEVHLIGRVDDLKSAHRCNDASHGKNIMAHFAV